MLRAIGSCESRMREIRTYGLTRERASLDPLYSTLKLLWSFLFLIAGYPHGTAKPDLLTDPLGTVLEPAVSRLPPTRRSACLSK
jgi:hypothetical protein